MTEKWWKNAVGYQIFPKTFYDSNADGFGDIAGITEKLPYLKELGVDFLWITPFYQSPGVDNGYDISDFRAIQETFGTMDDFNCLLKNAHEMGLKILLDLVVNHTSDRHPWFIESRKSKDNPYRHYYHWADATQEKLPNEWQSFFGGSVWEVEPQQDQAYLHIFYKEQPDLNWKNPNMRQEIYEMVRFWLDLGIDGFRLDAISHLQKEDYNFQIQANPWAPFMNVSGIAQYVRELKDIFDEYDAMSVGEASGVTSKEARIWTGSSGFMDMIFELEHNKRAGKVGFERIDVLAFKKVLARWQKDLADTGWNALYVENHDNARINSLLGNETEKSAKAIAMCYLFLKGTPFIYQGQEIGMNNFPFTEIEQVEDLSDKRHYQTLLDEGKTKEEALRIITRCSRDNARTLMQWTNTESAGFTNGKSPFPVPENIGNTNVFGQLNDEHSVLRFYKTLLAYRKAQNVFVEGTFELLCQDDPDTFVYIRKLGEQTRLILVNLTEKDTCCSLPNWLFSKKWALRLTNTKEVPLTKEMSFSGYDAYLFESEEE